MIAQAGSSTKSPHELSPHELSPHPRVGLLVIFLSLTPGSEDTGGIRKSKALHD